VLGKNVTSSTVGREASPYGGGGNERYARVNDDGDTVWQVDGQFYDLQPKAEDWIDKSFIEISKIKDIEVTTANTADNWKASRKEETGEFTLSDTKAGEDFDKDKAALTNVLSNPTFNDVVPKDKANADFMKGASSAKISTFEGFTYVVNFIKKGAGPDEKHYMTVAVSGDFPKERAAVKDEKPEDKKKNDDEFAAKKKTLEEKLAKEKKSEGWVFEIGSYVLGGIEKKRSEILKDKPASAPTAPGAPPAPKPPVSVTTPPISVPPAPAPAKPADKPAEAGKPPAPKPNPPITVTTPPVSVPATPIPPKPELKAPPKDPIKGDAPAADAAKPAPAPAPKPEEPKK
jgi:hypothetical protein